MSLMRQPLLLLSRSVAVKRAVTTMPVSAGVVGRYVPGETTADAVRASAELVAQGLRVTLDFLGEDVTELAHAEATVAAYLELVDELHIHGLGRSAEVSVKLTAIGLALPDGEQVALDHARQICTAARLIGTTVTLDMEDHSRTDATLAVLHELRHEFPETGAVLQAYLHRTEEDCRQLAHEGSRVRLCKGAYDEPEEVAWQSKVDVDRSYVRCLKVLMGGRGFPMVATHDPRMIQVASALAAANGRPRGTYEFQLLYGIRPDEQQRLADEGETVRVYVPYGQEWYGYLMRRLAERPRNLSFFVKSLVSKK